MTFAAKRQLQMAPPDAADLEGSGGKSDAMG